MSARSAARPAPVLAGEAAVALYQEARKHPSLKAGENRSTFDRMRAMCRRALEATSLADRQLFCEAADREAMTILRPHMRRMLNGGGGSHRAEMRAG